jgi:tight adherence protein B
MPDYNSYTLSAKEKTRYYCMAALAMLLVGQIFYQSLAVSLLLTPLSIPMKRLYESHMAEKRRVALGLSFRDLLYSLSASFATGRQMPEALKEGLEALRLIYSDGAPIVLELEGMVARLFNAREDEASILGDFARRSHNEDIQGFVDAYFICRSTGGDLENLVVKSAAVILDKMNVQKEIRTITAQKRLESKILLVIPAAMLMVLQMFSPDYTAALYETAAGRLIMTAALGISAVSYLWGLKLAKLDI